MSAEAGEIVGDGLDSDAAIATWLRAERDEGRLAFDADDRPAPGTSCWMCSHGQPAYEADADREFHRHRCPAKGWLGEYAVCAACGDGYPCGQALAVEERLRASDGVGGLAQEVNLPGPVRQVPLSEAVESVAAADHPWAAVRASLSVENLRRVKRCAGCGGKMWHLSAGDRCRECFRKAAADRRAAKAVEREATRAARMDVKAKGLEVGPVGASETDGGKAMAGGKTNRISDEIRAKVKAEFGSMSNEALGRKYGISGASVGLICGRKTRGAKSAPAAKGWSTTPAAKKAAARVLATLPAIPRAADAHLGGGGAMATLQVPEAALDRMFAVLGLEAKARLIQHALLEGRGEVGA